MKTIKTYEGFLDKAKKFFGKKNKLNKISVNEMYRIISESFVEVSDIGLGVYTEITDYEYDETFSMYKITKDLTKDYISVTISGDTNTVLEWGWTPFRSFRISKEFAECLKFAIPYLEDSGLKFAAFIIIYDNKTKLIRKNRFSSKNCKDFIRTIEEGTDRDDSDVFFIEMIITTK